MKHFLILSFAFISIRAVAQQSPALNELAKIREYYSPGEPRHIKGDILLTNNSNKLIDKVPFEYWTKDKKFFTKMGYLEILLNDSFYILINNKEKSVYSRPASNLPKKQGQAGIMFGAEQLNKLLKSKGVKVALSDGGDKSGKGILILDNLPDPKYKRITIFFDPTDHHIDRVEGIVKESAPGANGQSLKMVVTYTLSEKGSYQELDNIFSSGRYLDVTNQGTKIFKKKYSGYKRI